MDLHSVVGDAAVSYTHLDVYKRQAQATITLDNSDGWLPIEFSEVEITRRAFRSGENEYLLNGRHVRLKDVADLLATSGLAERTYTIVGQGLVDQALSLRSDAVSYTHLDVYKRQRPNAAVRWRVSLSSICLARSPSSMPK